MANIRPICCANFRRRSLKPVSGDETPSATRLSRYSLLLVIAFSTWRMKKALRGSAFPAQGQ